MAPSTTEKSPQTPPVGVGTRPERVALAGLVLQTLIAALTFLVYVHTGYDGKAGLRGAGSVFGELLHLAPGVVVWLLCYLRLRLERLADEEEREMEAQSRRADASSSLFETSGKPDAYTAKGRLERLESVFVPGATVLCGLAMVIIGFLVLGDWLRLRPQPVAERLAVSGAFLLAFAFVGFAFSQYIIGLSLVPRCRNLRPAGAYLLSNSFVLSVCALALWLCRAEVPVPERLLAHALPVLVILIGIEYLTNFLLDFFRPRLPGQVLRPAYDSRLFGLFAQPGSLWNAIADTLDYQFGFRVSKTWFYSFVARLILPLMAFQLVSALLLTCVVVVDFDEVVIVERFGKPAEKVLSPGFHLKLPWPMEQAYPVPAGRTQRVFIGLHDQAGEHAEMHGSGHGHSHGGPQRQRKLPENVHAWTDTETAHADYILLASREAPVEADAGDESGRQRQAPAAADRQRPVPEGASGASVPVNALDVALVVHFRVADSPPALFDYFYRQADPEHYLESIAYRELVQLASTVDLHDLMGPRRLELTGQLRDRIGAKVREERLGVEVVYVGFLGIHPPVPVAPAFQSVVEAQELALSQIVVAQSYAQRTVPEARTQGTTLVNDAQADKSRQELVGKAEEESFKNHVTAYEQASPAIYRSRYFLAALEEALRGKRKIILPANVAEESFVIKLEDKLRADLLNIDLEKE